MNLKKTNKELHDELKKDGKLASNLKNGEPKATAQKILALGYPIIVLIALVGTIIAIVKNREKMRWDVFIPHMIIGSLCGWCWGIYMEKFDPNYPAWLFHPWAIVGPEWLMTIEDWFFYPVFGSLFYVIYRILKYDPKPFIKIVGKSIPTMPLKWAIQIAHIGITLFFIYFSEEAGRSIAFQFALPGIVLFFYTWDRWDIKHYSKVFLFITILATVWDWVAVSWIAYIPGFSWASQWVYVSFDVNGIAHHSSVFLSYADHRWAWIFNNPIEITPWFGIAGAMFTYSLALAIEKFIDESKKIINIKAELVKGSSDLLNKGGLCIHQFIKVVGYTIMVIMVVIFILPIKTLRVYLLIKRQRYAIV